MAVGFTEDGAKRIARAVRRVERMPWNGNSTPRRRNVMPSARPNTLGLATCTVDACDLTSSLTGATMPDCTADISLADGAEWAVGPTGATIYNPLPFKFTSALCWVRYSGNAWLIERAAEWQPGAHLQCGTVGVVNPLRWASFPYHKGDIIRRENSNGRIAINVPVSNRPFRLQIRVRVNHGTGQTEWHGELQLQGNLYGSATVDVVKFGAPSVSPSGNNSLELGFDEIVSWSKDDYFEVHLRDQVGNAAGADFGFMTITPLF